MARLPLERETTNTINRPFTALANRKRNPSNGERSPCNVPAYQVHCRCEFLSTLERKATRELLPRHIINRRALTERAALLSARFFVRIRRKNAASTSIIRRLMRCRQWQAPQFRKCAMPIGELFADKKGTRNRERTGKNENKNNRCGQRFRSGGLLNRAGIQGKLLHRASFTMRSGPGVYRCA